MPRRIIRTERHRRGPVGWIVKIAFIIFNAAMLFYAGSIFYHFAQPLPHDPAKAAFLSAVRQHSDAAIFGALLFLIAVWALGSIILGTLMYFTRGRKVIVEDVYE